MPQHQISWCGGAEPRATGYSNAFLFRDAELPVVRGQRNHLCDLLGVPRPQPVPKVRLRALCGHMAPVTSELWSKENQVPVNLFHTSCECCFCPSGQVLSSQCGAGDPSPSQCQSSGKVASPVWEGGFDSLIPCPDICPVRGCLAPRTPVPSSWTPVPLGPSWLPVLSWPYSVWCF